MTRKILIADNDRYYCQKLIDLYKRLGYETIIVEDGRKATKVLASHEIDLAVIEYNIPGKRGDRILSIIKEKDIPTPVIIIAENNTNEIERSVRCLGAGFFFVKPFDLNDMRIVSDKLFTVRDKNYVGIAKDTRISLHKEK